MNSALIEPCNEMVTEISRFPWSERAAYCEWLAQTYYYVRHSTRLLASAAARFPFDKRGDNLHHRFATHVGEEKRHEQLALHDLKQLGGAISDLPERPSTCLFYEPQYYKIEHQTPMALFGYIIPLEAIGPMVGKSVIERITGAFGERCASFLKVHVVDDVEHLEKALAILDSATESERQLINENIRQTVFAYCSMLADIRTSLQGAVIGGQRP